MLNTSQKMVAAQLLLRILKLMGIKSAQVAKRNGIVFVLNLNEGIDLSLFLFGTFQNHILSVVKRYIPKDGIVFDVGANIGSISLPIASILPDGHVYAFEPTEYAFNKLRINISKNAFLMDRITPVNVFVSDKDTSDSHLVAYSSWLLNNDSSLQRHPDHKGIIMPAVKDQISLDAFVSKQKIRALSLIKIDTDGHEYDVLSGAQKTISRFRPLIIFEACEYLMSLHNHPFEIFEAFFKDHSYFLCETGGNGIISAKAFRKKCPKNGGLDLLAIPQEKFARDPFRTPALS